MPPLLQVELLEGHWVRGSVTSDPALGGKDSVVVGEIVMVHKGILCSVGLSLACKIRQKRAVSPISVTYHSFKKLLLFTV